MPKSARQKSHSYENGHARKSYPRGKSNGKRSRPRRERQRKQPPKTLSAIDVFNLCKADSKVMRAIANREYVYVDGHIILNSHSCLEVRNGRVHIKLSVFDSLERYTYRASHSKNKSSNSQRSRILPWGMYAQKNPRGHRYGKSKEENAPPFQIFAQT